GSGKSTLIQHMNGLLKPTAGRIWVDGVDLFDKKTNKREVRQKIGLVFQYPEHQLFEETVAKDVAFGPHNLGLGQKEVDVRVREACARVGLEESISDRSPFELSGGQMRRVAIAGVLAMRPKVLILDEPTAGLDPAGREEILSMVRRLHHEEGVTVIMVSHSMEDMAQLATRLVVMNHGTIALCGTPREIFAQGETLQQMGLDVPAMVRLADALRARGIPLPAGIYRREDMYEALLARLKGDVSC
ncbi:MAG: energy-coupling factor transporter ATPase, partial [Clostridia bacterium]